VPHASVTLIDQRGRQIGRATTASDGSYAVRTPTAGNYVLVGSAPGHQPQVATLAVGASPLEFDLTLAGSGGLTGSVRAGGAPVTKALVVATDARGEVVGSATTDAGGGYRLAELVPGAYTVAVNAFGYRPTAGQADIRTGTPTVHDVELLPGAELRGTVRTRDGRPLTQAKVSLLDHAGDVVGALITGEDGAFAFTDLVGAQYTVIASGYPAAATQIAVDGANQEGIDISLAHHE
jgi:hypothetical protein